MPSLTVYLATMGVNWHWFNYWVTVHWVVSTDFTVMQVYFHLYFSISYFKYFMRDCIINISYQQPFWDHLSNEHFLAIILDGHGKVPPCQPLIVVLKNWQQEHEVRDVQDMLVLVTLNTHTSPLASCLTDAQPLLAHRPAADDNSLIGCTGHDLTDWSLASAHFVDSQYEFRCSFGCVLLSNQIYLAKMYHSTIPLRFICSIFPGN